MTEKQDAAMLKLYEALSVKPPSGVRGMSVEERREYDRAAKRRSRAADRVAGPAQVTDAVRREALADAAQAILATGAEGAAAIEKLLMQIFPAKPAVVVGIIADARSGRLKPKLLKPT